MKIKLDENVHGGAVAVLTARGHDVCTVREEGLAGCPDAELARKVQAESRCLVTFDLDFADTRRYPPAEFAGLVVLRLRIPTGLRQIERINSFFAEKPQLKGQLWIVEEDRARDGCPPRRWRCSGCADWRPACGMPRWAPGTGARFFRPGVSMPKCPV